MSSRWFVAMQSDQAALTAAGMGAILCLLVGLAVSGAAPELTFIGGILVGGVVLARMFLRPRLALWPLVAFSVFLPVMVVLPGRTINPIDILLPACLLGTWMWFDGRAGPRGSPEIERSRNLLVRSVLAFYGVAVLSLVVLTAKGRMPWAIDSLLILTRSFEGALLFFLLGRLARWPQDVYWVRNAVLIGFGVSFVINLIGILQFDIPRAGAIWIPGYGDWTLKDPNEAALAVPLVWAMALGIPFGRGKTAVVLLLSLVFLFMTQSRSGLLALVAFVVTYGLTVGSRWSLLLPVGMAASYPLLPAELAGRFARTLVLQRGSSEAFSALVRAYSWKASFQVFLDNPIIGVGYLGYRFVSPDYNPFGVVLVTAESMYLEVAADMGILGLIALAMVGFAMIKVSRTIRRVRPPGSVAHRLAGMTAPYAMSFAVASLVGDNLVGLLAAAQLAVFFGILLQAARLETSPQAAATQPDPA